MTPRFALTLVLLGSVVMSHAQAQVAAELSRRVAEAAKLQQKGRSAHAKQELEAERSPLII